MTRAPANNENTKCRRAVHTSHPREPTQTSRLRSSRREPPRTVGRLPPPLLVLLNDALLLPLVAAEGASPLQPLLEAVLVKDVAANTNDDGARVHRGGALQTRLSEGALADGAVPCHEQRFARHASGSHVHVPRLNRDDEVRVRRRRACRSRRVRHDSREGSMDRQFWRLSFVLRVYVRGGGSPRVRAEAHPSEGRRRLWLMHVCAQ